MAQKLFSILYRRHSKTFLEFLSEQGVVWIAARFGDILEEVVHHVELFGMFHSGAYEKLDQRTVVLFLEDTIQCPLVYVEVRRHGRKGMFLVQLRWELCENIVRIVRENWTQHPITRCVQFFKKRVKKNSWIVIWKATWAISLWDEQRENLKAMPMPTWRWYLKIKNTLPNYLVRSQWNMQADLSTGTIM